MEITVQIKGLDPIVQALNALAVALRPSPSLLAPITALSRSISPEDNPATGTEVPLALMKVAADPVADLFAAPVADLFAAPVAPVAPVAPAVPAVPAVPAPPVIEMVALHPLPPLTPAVPPPPPEVPVFTAPPAPTPAVAPAPEVDSTGLRWDARIHATNKSLNKDGTWRQRRGTADAYVKEVEAQLRGVSASVTVAAPVAGDIDFGTLSMKLAGPMAEGKVTIGQLNDACVKLGAANYTVAMSQPHLAPLIAAELGLA